MAEIGALLIWTRSHFAARLRGNAIMSPSLLWHTAEGGDQAILRPAGLKAACAYRDIPFLEFLTRADRNQSSRTAKKRGELA